MPWNRTNIIINAIGNLMARIFLMELKVEHLLWNPYTQESKSNKRCSWIPEGRSEKLLWVCGDGPKAIKPHF